MLTVPHKVPVATRNPERGRHATRGHSTLPAGCVSQLPHRTVARKPINATTIAPNAEQRVRNEGGIHCQSPTTTALSETTRYPPQLFNLHCCVRISPYSPRTAQSTGKILRRAYTNPNHVDSALHGGNSTLKYPPQELVWRNATHTNHTCITSPIEIRWRYERWCSCGCRLLDEALGSIVRSKHTMVGSNPARKLAKRTASPLFTNEC